MLSQSAARKSPRKTSPQPQKPPTNIRIASLKSAPPRDYRPQLREASASGERGLPARGRELPAPDPHHRLSPLPTKSQKRPHDQARHSRRFGYGRDHEIIHDHPRLIGS